MYSESANESVDVEVAESEWVTPTGPRLDLMPPPFCEAVDGPDYSNSMVSIEVNSGQRVKGKLTYFDTDAELLGIIESSKSEPTEIEFQSIKFLRLEKPYQLTLEGPSKDDKISSVEFASDARSFHVYFKDRTELSGKTYGSRVDRNGIHFYERQKSGRKWRYCVHLFVARAAVENYVIGEQIGGMLVKENAITQKDLESVLKEQQTERSQLLGEYLVESKVVNKEELEKVLARQESMPNVKLGELLTSENVITESQLLEALKAQKQKRKNSLGEILVSKGVLNREKIQQCLARKLGIPFVNLRQFPIDPKDISLIDAELAYNRKVVPLYTYDGKVVVAVENPMDWQIIDALSFDLNRCIEPVMASAEDINWALHFYYMADDVTRIIGVGQQDAPGAEESFDTGTFSSFELSQVTDAGATKIVNKIIEDAYRQKVSDIHFEPGTKDQKVTVRFRKDESLSVYYKFPSKFRSVFASRVKVMAHLDVANKRRIQEGKIAYRNFGSMDIELRVTTLPTAGGNEDVVIKISRGGRCLPINAIGLNTIHLDRVIETVSHKQGLFLLCGPAHSGKSTSLHAILNHLNQADRKIWTAEDPIKVNQSGLRQVEIDAKSGMGFSQSFKGIVQADPDVIMLSDLSDLETAKQALTASLKGKLVMAGLSTESAASTINRLLSMGVRPLDLADGLLGILSQRLVRTLCLSCKKPYRAEKRELEFLATEYCRESYGVDDAEDPGQPEVDRQIREWESKLTVDGVITLYKAPGCKDCMETGYRGHIGVHSLTTNTQAIKRLIIERSDDEEFRLTSLISGSRSLKQDGIEKILLGYTDFPQVRTL